METLDSMYDGDLAVQLKVDVSSLVDLREWLESIESTPAQARSNVLKPALADGVSCS